MIVPTPQWVVTVVAHDRDGTTDYWTEVITEPGLNRRQAIAAAVEGLPGTADDPLTQRMIAYSAEAGSGLHVPSTRVRVAAVSVALSKTVHPAERPDLDDRPTVTVKTADILDLAVRGCDLMAGGGDTWLPGVDASAADRWWFDMKVAAGIEESGPDEVGHRAPAEVSS